MTFHYPRSWFIFYWNTLSPFSYSFFTIPQYSNKSCYSTFIYQEWMTGVVTTFHISFFSYLNISLWIAKISKSTERTWNWTENENFSAPSNTCLTVFSNWIFLRQFIINSIFRSFIVKKYNSNFEWCLPTPGSWWLFSKFFSRFHSSFCYWTQVYMAL